MVFGGVCATVTSIIAESLKGWNLVQVRCAIYSLADFLKNSLKAFSVKVIIIKIKLANAKLEGQ